MVAIDVNGIEYPCHSFQPNTIGDTIMPTPIFPELNDWSDPECGDCFINNMCTSCYGFNFLQYGNILTQDKTMCGIKKVVVLASSYYAGLLIERGMFNIPKKELARTVKAIMDIQDKYSTIMEEL